MTIEHYYNAAWRDITDYIDAIGKVPRGFRNRDYTLKADYVDIDVAITIQGSAVYPINFEFAVDEIIRIKDRDGILVWIGLIEKSIYNYREMKFEMTIKNRLLKLRDILMSYAVLHTSFASGIAGQYWTDLYGNNSVSVMWAIEKIFILSGLTIDIPSTLKTTPLFTRTTDSNWRGRTITFADLYFDEDQLWCLGKSYALIHGGSPLASVFRTVNQDELLYGLTGSASYLTNIIDNKPEINCFDFISEILTSLKLTIKAYGNEGYQLVNDNTIYAIIDDNKFEYGKENISPEKGGIGWRWTTLNLSGDWLASNSFRDRFRSVTQYNFSEVSTNDNSSISIMNNFAIYFADTNIFSSDYGESVCEPDLSENLIIGDNGVTAHLNVIAARYRNIAITRIIETITTDYQSTLKSTELHEVDAQWDNSEIEQGV